MPTLTHRLEPGENFVIPLGYDRVIIQYPADPAYDPPEWTIWFSIWLATVITLCLYSIWGAYRQDDECKYKGIDGELLVMVPTLSLIPIVGQIIFLCLLVNHFWRRK